MSNAVEGSGREAVMDAKAMFQRVIGPWAVDVLALRRRGWDRPCLRTAVRTPAAPGKASRRAPRRRAA